MANEGVEIERLIDSSLLTWPKPSIAAYGDGSNRVYCDLRGATWDEVDESLELETALLEQASFLPEDLNDLVDEEDWLEMDGLDVGIVSVVRALSAARCIPLASCNGSFGHREQHPLVVFWARKALAPQLIASAEQADCGLVNSSEGTILVYASNIRSMIAFARSLRAEFSQRD